MSALPPKSGHPVSVAAPSASGPGEARKRVRSPAVVQRKRFEDCTLDSTNRFSSDSFSSNFGDSSRRLSPARLSIILYGFRNPTCIGETAPSFAERLRLPWDARPFVKDNMTARREVFAIRTSHFLGDHRREFEIDSDQLLGKTFNVPQDEVVVDFFPTARGSGAKRK